MFGLMKARTCSATAEIKLRRRLHYCGTCKTIGRLYGQKARLLLNNDTVFLAELLTALSGDDRELSGWAAEYRSYNCLSLPSAAGDMPVALQLAAAATMVMAEFKIADRIADSQGRGWKLARRFLDNSIKRATSALKGWEFPVDELRECWTAQIDRERSAAIPAGMNWDEVLLLYADPTATAAGLFFEQGARIACGGLAAAEMRAVGGSFGELIYVLDALEDYEKDAASRGFNPLRLALPGAGQRLGGEDRDRTIGVLHEIRLKIESGLARLPIPADQAGLFIGRLRSNLSSRIGIKLPVLAQSSRTCTHHRGNRSSLRDRVREAMILGRGLTRRHLEEECGSWAAGAMAPLVFAQTAAMALLFPEQARTLGSARESFGMPFNLILVGGLVRSWPRIFLKPIPPSSLPPGAGRGQPPGGGPMEPPEVDAAEQARRHAQMATEEPKKGGCGCCCDADCCDCCDCCDCLSGCDC
jgi:hypothetical protein